MEVTICKDAEKAIKDNATAIEAIGAALKKLPTRQLRCKGFDKTARSILKGNVLDADIQKIVKIFGADITADKTKIDDFRKRITDYVSTKMPVDRGAQNKLVKTDGDSKSKYTPHPPRLMQYQDIDAKGKQNLVNRSKARTSKVPDEKICSCHKNLEALDHISTHEYTSQDLKPCSYSKLITFKYEGTADSEEKKFQGFKIHHYKEWLDDLKNCLTQRGSIIYIPTKERSKKAQIIYNKEEFMEVTEQSQGLPYLVYAFVEEQELDEYITNFKTQDPDNLVFVSIPGKDRGVWFVRSLILILQRLQRVQLAAQKISFNLWWMNDDDVKEVRAFDREAKFDCMHTCSLGLAMKYAEQVLEHHISQSDSRYDVADDGSKTLSDWTIRKLEGFFSGIDNEAWVETRKEDRTEKINLLHNELKFTRKDFNYHQFNCKDSKKTHKAIDKLYKDWNAKGSDATQRIAQLALCPRNLTTRNNYNIQTGKGCQYRVSDQRHAFILFNSESFEGYSYYSWDALMWSQAKVDKETELAKQSTDEMNSFLGEDKVIVQRLAADGRAGLLLYCFDVKSPAPTSSKGGCRKFRTFESIQIRHRPFKIHHRCEKQDNSTTNE